MSLQFGPTKIGAMQYNGVTIGEALYNGQTVYRSMPPGLTHWAKFDAGALTLNSGSAGGSFTQTGEATSTPPGVTFPSGGYMSHPVDPFPSGITLCAWVKIGSPGYPFGVAQVSPSLVAVFFDGESGRAQLNIDDTSVAAPALTAADINKWAHVAFSAWPDGTTWRLRAYRNGTVSGNAQTIPVTTPALTGASSGIGGLPGILTIWAGEVDEYRLWSRAVGDAEIAAIYAAEAATHPA